MEKAQSVHTGWRLALFGFLVSLLWSTPVLSADVTLAWDPNSDADLEGYGVYLRKDTQGPLYDLAGYVTLAELDDVNAPTFVVSGLEKGFRYYFAATAYDTEGNESAFSNVVCADIGDTVTACSSSSDGGGGGGGFGCFIGAASEANEPLFLSLLALATAGCIMLFATGISKPNYR